MVILYFSDFFAKVFFGTDGVGDEGVNYEVEIKIADWLLVNYEYDVGRKR